MLKDLLKTIKSKDRSKNTIIGLEYTLQKVQDYIEKPLETASYDELKNYINTIKEERDLSQATIEGIQRKLIQFYNFCFNSTDDPKYLKIIRHIKNDKVDKPKSHIEPKDIITPEEVKKLINVATIERDRCIVAVLFESGMRIGELMALKNDMVQIDDQKQEVIFHIPRQEGCKTGSRSVTCLEVHGYVQDWLKCNPSSMFMPITIDGARKAVARLFEKAGVKKPCNVHMLRHSAITYSASLGMSETELSYRFWGIPHSTMVSVYIHLNAQMQAQGYRNAKGMGEKEVKVVNPLASRCVECGKLIQSGSLCSVCSEIKELRVIVKEQDKKIALMQHGFVHINVKYPKPEEALPNAK